MRLAAMMSLPAAAAAVATVVGLLAACTVVVDEGPGYRPLPPERPRVCTAEYLPVCARRGGERQSFSNGCMAERAGYRVIREGLCRGEAEDGDDGRTFCTREYAPVCARRRGDVRTFPNACEARAARWRVIGDGPC